MKNEIQKTLEVLAGSFRKESDTKNADWVQNVVKEYDYLNIREPEHFTLLIFQTLEDKADTLLRTVISHIDIEQENKHKLEFVYLHYGFIERHLKTVILKFQGHVCSTDNTRWLINTYVQYLISREVPIIEEKKYWHPECGDVRDWMTWIASMYELYYGQIEQYVSAKDKISKCYENKFQT